MSYSKPCSVIVDELIKLGADINCKDDDGWTPLHIACDVETVKKLIQFGADTNIKDNEGRTQLELLCEQKTSFNESDDEYTLLNEMIEKLSELRAD